MWRRDEKQQNRPTENHKNTHPRRVTGANGAGESMCWGSQERTARRDEGGRGAWVLGKQTD